MRTRGIFSVGIGVIALALPAMSAGAAGAVARPGSVVRAFGVPARASDVSAASVATPAQVMPQTLGVCGTAFGPELPTPDGIISWNDGGSSFDTAGAADVLCDTSTTVDSVEVYGYFGLPTETFHVTFYGDSPSGGSNEPDDPNVICDYPSLTGQAGGPTPTLTHLDLSPACELPSGVSWVSVQNVDPGQPWYWEMQDGGLPRGAGGAASPDWIDRSDVFASGCTAFSNDRYLVDCLGFAYSDWMLVLGGEESGGTFVQYTQPNEAYLEDMCTIDPSVFPQHTEVTGIEMPGQGCGVHDVSFWKPSGSPDGGRTTDTQSVEVLKVPDTWPTWGAPPWTQTATPWVLYTQGATSVEMTFGIPGQYAGTNCKAGVEVQPSGAGLHHYRGDYLDYLGNVLGTVYGTASSPGGARLLGAAATGDPRIKSMVVTDVSTDITPTDFALAQINDCRGGGTLGNIKPIKSKHDMDRYNNACHAKFTKAQQGTFITSLNLNKSANPARECGNQSVTFYSINPYTLPLEIRKASWPNTWITGQPKPYVLSTGGATSLLLSFSQPQRLVGMEIQPIVPGSHDYMAEFRDANGTLIGTVYKTASAPGGAKLLAGQMAPGLSAQIASVRITDISATATPCGFGIAQLKATTL